MGAFDKIVDGIKAVAPTVANIVVPGSGHLLEGLMRAVTDDNVSDIEAVAGKIEADPKLYVELQKMAMEREVSLAQIDAAKLATVNATMQAESRSEKWPQYSWRPWNGFWFAPSIVLIYFLLPVLKRPVPDIPQWVWLGYLAVLGVATYQRGKKKRIEAGEQKTGLLEGAIKAIRG